MYCNYNTTRYLTSLEVSVVVKEINDFTHLDKIDNKATGQRIKFLVQTAGFSQKELAEVIRRDIKTISNYYCGISLPDKNDLLILSRILGIPYDEILIFKGDIEGYQRLEYYSIEYNGQDGETVNEAIERSKRESKLFNQDTKGRANIRNLEEAGFCLQFFSKEIEQDIRKRMMDELLSGSGIHSMYMYHIYEFYIWRKLSDEQQAKSKKQFAYWRGEVESC